MNPLWLIALVGVWYLGKSSATAAVAKPAAKPADTSLKIPTEVKIPTEIKLPTKVEIPAEIKLPTDWQAPKAATTPPATDMPAAGSTAETILFGTLPDSVRANVLDAYRNGSSPDKLDELATQLETTYPAVAAALHARASYLRANSQPA